MMCKRDTIDTNNFNIKKRLRRLKLKATRHIEDSLDRPLVILSSPTIKLFDVNDVKFTKKKTLITVF